MQTADRATLYRFFALPAAAAHESWLTFIPPEIVSISRRSRLGILILSRMLTRHAQLPEPRSFDMTAQYRWVLADTAALMEAALKLGAMTLGKQIATAIARERVKLYRTAFGDELYREAVGAGATQMADVPAAELEARSTAEALRDLAQRVGIALMLAILPNDAMRSRLAVKFPQSLSASPGVSLQVVNKPVALERMRVLAGVPA